MDLEVDQQITVQQLPTPSVQLNILPVHQPQPVSNLSNTPLLVPSSLFTTPVLPDESTNLYSKSNSYYAYIRG